MIDKLREVFGSVIKALEIIYVMEGNKPAARIMVKDNIFDDAKSFLGKYKLYVTKSDFKVKKEDSGEYSDKGSKISEKEKGYYFVYISKLKEKAEKAKKLEALQDHVGLGIALGYPKCCCEFFNKNFEAESSKDFTLATLRESDGFKFPFYNNIAVRHFDISLLNHFPCSFNCKESAKIAERNLDIIKEYSNDWYLIFKGTLKSTVLYTDEYIFLLRDFKLEDNKLFFNNVMSSANNELYRKLKDNDFIEIIGKDKVKVGDEELKNVGVMVFN